MGKKKKIVYLCVDLVIEVHPESLYIQEWMEIKYFLILVLYACFSFICLKDNACQLHLSS